MKLPQDFLTNMRQLMEEEEYRLFIESFNRPKYSGLRVNTLKLCVENFKKISPFKLEEVPWCNEGFYLNEGENPGKHPYYYAGLYYIQEPSAMLPAETLAPRPGEKVLDLCAAPGGKTVQMAAKMKGKGLIIANDISNSRAKALVKNLELWGIKNAVVTVDSPQNLSKKLEGFFDRILVDAPCSGEGMFRKEEDSVRSWQNFKNEKYSLQQREILKYADKMLKLGGYLTYSTCTFSPIENEQIVSWFLETNKSYEIVDINKTESLSSGRPQWCRSDNQISKSVRIWPHISKGEGHFAALLKKTGNNELIVENTNTDFLEMPAEVADFASENLNMVPMGTYTRRGDSIYVLPEKLPNLDGIIVIKTGWYLGEIRNRKLEPSHAFIMGLAYKDIRRTLDLDPDSLDTIKYLKGETLIRTGEKGLYGFCLGQYPLGWVVQTEGILKNRYPKGWRKMK